MNWPRRRVALQTLSLSLTHCTVAYRWPPCEHLVNTDMDPKVLRNTSRLEALKFLLWQSKGQQKDPSPPPPFIACPLPIALLHLYPRLCRSKLFMVCTCRRKPYRRHLRRQIWAGFPVTLLKPAGALYNCFKCLTSFIIVSKSR